MTPISVTLSKVWDQLHLALHHLIDLQTSAHRDIVFRIKSTAEPCHPAPCWSITFQRSLRVDWLWLVQISMVSQCETAAKSCARWVRWLNWSNYVVGGASIGTESAQTFLKSVALLTKWISFLQYLTFVYVIYIVSRKTQCVVKLTPIVLIN